MKLNEIVAAVSFAPLVLGLTIACTAGCENKEKVLEIDTPNRSVDIERDRDTGEVDVNVDKKGDKVIDIETPGADVEVTR